MPNARQITFFGSSGILENVPILLVHLSPCNMKGRFHFTSAIYDYRCNVFRNILALTSTRSGALQILAAWQFLFTRRLISYNFCNPYCVMFVLSHGDL